MSESTTADPNADAGAGDPPADDPGSLFALADTADSSIAKDDAGKPIKPDWISDQFWDAQAGQVKVAELAKSQRDLRAQISRGDHKPPETPDKYVPPKLDGLPADFIGGKDDALWPEVAKAAHAAGITQKQLEALAAPMLAQAAQRMQAEDPAAAEAAAREAATAELAKLGPNASQVVKDVAAWLNGLAGRGTITREELASLRSVSTAAGIRALSKLRELSGDQPIPTDALDGGDMTVADAQRLMTDGYAKNDMSLVKKGRDYLARLEAQGVRI